MNRETLIDKYGEELLFLEPGESFDRCIVGVAHRCGLGPVVCYDQELVTGALMLGGMDREEAEEWFGFNTAGAYMGPHTPVFLMREEAEA